MEVSKQPSNRGNNAFGRYRVLAKLGHGGMAAIHLAVMEGPSGFNKLVVLKQILPEYAGDTEIVAMFLDEARLAARLHHSNVVQTNEVGFDDDTHFLAMEYLDGQPLAQILRRLRHRGGLPLGMHLQVISDLLAGLHYVHELEDYDGSPLGVVHCDVGPQNTFVTYDGVVKLVDFGVAKSRTALAAPRPGVVKGKFAYMAPEQMRGEDPDRRADIFAVGVMLWEAATGRRPWSRLGESSIVESVLAGHYPAPCSANPAVAIELETIILKALSFDRESRYSTALELQSAVDGYLATIGGRLAQREIGKLISTHFASERGVVTSVIEEQLEACAQAPPGEPPPLPLLIRSPADGSRDTLYPDTRPSMEVSAVRGPPSPPLGPPSSGRTVRELATSSRSAVPRSIVAVAALALAAGGLAGARWWWEARSSRSDLVAAVSASTSSPAAPAPSTVHLQLVASPLEARFFLDDVPLEGNPYQGDLAPDGRVHRIRAEAAGFLARTESVTLDRNTLVDIELAREPLTGGKSPRAREAPRPHASSSASSSVVGPLRAPIIVQW